MRSPQQPVDRSDLVDQGQRAAEGVNRGPGGLWEIGGVGEGVDVIQILHPACQSHHDTRNEQDRPRPPRTANENKTKLDSPQSAAGR